MTSRGTPRATETSGLHPVERTHEQEPGGLVEKEDYPVSARIGGPAETSAFLGSHPHLYLWEPKGTQRGSSEAEADGASLSP